MSKIIKLKKKNKKGKNKKTNANVINSNEIHININTDAKPKNDKTKNDKNENDKSKKLKLRNSIFGTTQYQSRIVTTYPSETRALIEDIMRVNPSRFNQLPLENMRRAIDHNTTFGYDSLDGVDVPTQANNFNTPLDQSLFEQDDEETQVPIKKRRGRGPAKPKIERVDDFFIDEEEYLQNLPEGETPNFAKANRRAEQEAARKLAKEDKAINYNLKREAKAKSKEKANK